ncbi:hypothetical protein JHK82_050530 [Glycine max]|nr:hypothetical protein JHK82_050530 [Glycine max]
MTRIDRYGSNSSVTPFNSFSFSVRNLSGEWISTPPVTGTLVCNIGDMLKFVDDMMRDLYEEGFMPNYYWWINHDEELPQFPLVVLQDSYYGSGDIASNFPIWFKQYELSNSSSYGDNLFFYKSLTCNDIGVPAGDPYGVLSSNIGVDTV